MSLAVWREPVDDAALGDLVARFAAAATERERFLLEEPDRGEGMLALGALRVLEASGPERFTALERAAAALFAELGDAEPAARLVGGFAFAASGGSSPAWRGFAPARLVLPGLLFVRRGGVSFCVAAAEAERPAQAREAARARAQAALRALADSPAPLGGDASRAEGFASAPAEGGGAAPGYRLRAEESAGGFAQRVSAALGAIAAGELEKVVPARAVCVERSTGGWDAGALLRGLRRDHRACTLYAAASGERVFLGATPEPLLRLAGDRIETAAVAGTAPRGRTPEEDAARARALIESKKEQAEHAAVVRAIRATLAPIAAEISSPESPRLLRLQGIQHLRTPIVARLARPEPALALLARLHPTPAVAGAPRAAALAWLGDNESLDRGWYAGPLGFIAADGGAHFCVALRAALLSGREARCFAGAGVVEGSQPHAESRETRAKLDALLRPLLEL